MNARNSSIDEIVSTRHYSRLNTADDDQVLSGNRMDSAILEHRDKMIPHRAIQNDIIDYGNGYGYNEEYNLLDNEYALGFQCGIHSIELRAKLLSPIHADDMSLKFDLIKMNGLSVNLIGTNLQFFVNPQQFYFANSSNPIYTGQKVAKRDLRSYLEVLAAKIGRRIQIDTLAIHSIEYAFDAYFEVYYMAEEYIDMAYRSCSRATCTRCLTSHPPLAETYIQLSNGDQRDISLSIYNQTINGYYALRFVLTVPSSSTKYVEKHKETTSLARVIAKEAKMAFSYMRAAFRAMEPIGGTHYPYEEAVNQISNIEHKRDRIRMAYLIKQAQRCKYLDQAIKRMQDKFMLSTEEVVHILDCFSELRMSPLTIRNETECDKLASLNALLQAASIS